MQNLDHRIPLRCVQVGTGRVVAATVQQDHIAFLRGLEVGDHAIEINATGVVVEITIWHHLHTQILEDRQVVRPCRVGHKDPCARAGHLDQFKRLTDRAGPARGRRRGDLCAGNRIAKYHLHHRIAKGRIACQTGIGLAGLSFPQLVFSRLDRAHDGRQPRGILVYAHTKVDLGLARVVLVHLHQGKDFIGRLRL